MGKILPVNTPSTPLTNPAVCFKFSPSEKKLNIGGKKVFFCSYKDKNRADCGCFIGS